MVKRLVVPAVGGSSSGGKNNSDENSVASQKDVSERRRRQQQQQQQQEEGEDGDGSDIDSNDDEDDDDDDTSSNNDDDDDDNENMIRRLDELLTAESNRPNTHKMLVGVQARNKRKLDYRFCGGKHSSSIIDPATEPFFVGSITKMMTASIIMQLVDENIIELDQRISAYLDHELSENIHVYKGQDYSYEVRVHELLHHTSGISDYFVEKQATTKPTKSKSSKQQQQQQQHAAATTRAAATSSSSSSSSKTKTGNNNLSNNNNKTNTTTTTTQQHQHHRWASLYDEIILEGNDQVFTTNDAVKWAKKLKPKFEPSINSGKKSYYSDTNYQLLGSIIENVTKKTLQENFQIRIFNRLHLSQNTYLYNYHHHDNSQSHQSHPTTSKTTTTTNQNNNNNNNNKRNGKSATTTAKTKMTMTNGNSSSSSSSSNHHQTSKEDSEAPPPPPQPNKVQPKRPMLFYYKERQLDIPKAMTSFGADGGVVSTLDDLLIFLRAYFDGTLFSTKHHKRMRSQWNMIFFPIQYGYGIMRFKMPRWMTLFLFDTPELLGHSGSNASFAFYCPRDEIFVTGSFNQIDQPSRPFQFMLQVIASLK